MKYFLCLFILLNVSSHLHGSELTCQQKINIKKNNNYYDNNDYKRYVLGVESEGVGESFIKWHKNGLVCGYTWNGKLNLEGFNRNNGVLDIQILSYDLTIQYRGTLYKNTTKQYINWKGKIQHQNNKKLFTFLKRKIDTHKNNSTDNSKFIKYREDKRLTEEDYFSNHGVYYCGDGGCEGLEIRILTYDHQINEAIEEITQLKTFIASVKVDNDELYCEIFKSKVQGHHNIPKNISIENTTCLIAETYPLREPEAVIEVRKLNTVLSARRLGGAAGAMIGFLSMHNISINGESYLTNRTQLNAVKFATTLDKSLKEHFSSQSMYISKPSYQNNSITWDMKGKKSDFTNDISDSSEWWKVQIQVFISQQNAGDYILGVGLPETRITKWALTNSIPSNSKFEKELTNDPMFLNLRGQLLIIFASDLDIQ